MAGDKSYVNIMDENDTIVKRLVLECLVFFIFMDGCFFDFENTTFENNVYI